MTRREEAMHDLRAMMKAAEAAQEAIKDAYIEIQDMAAYQMTKLAELGDKVNQLIETLSKAAEEQFNGITEEAE